MTSAERAIFILKVLDTAQWNVFPSEEDIETLSPHVDQIRADYEEQRGRGFHGAFMASRAKFLAAAITQAQNDKLEEAAQAIDAVAAGVTAAAIYTGQHDKAAEILRGGSDICRALKSKDTP